MLLSAFLTLRYLHWRVSETLNLSGPWVAGFSCLVFAAELWLLAHWLLLLLFTLVPEVSRRSRAAVIRGMTCLSTPWVDVLVPSCGEPLAVVERCLRGCRSMTYPRVVVWLLDDTGRPELQALCARLGCRYRQRLQHDHAKAGNLNYVLPELQGELLAVFDADVVPVQAFLSRTVGCFADSAVGLVQTPQTYMNADPVIRNLGLERWLLPDEESFYRWIEPVRQRLDAVVCAGTSFVVRRTALLDVGGFETGTSSEDLATGIRLTAAGWRCLFLPEKLSAGLAPLTAAALIRQRCRWASGTLQTLRTGANPLRISGLTLWQRLAYAEGILHWLNVVPQIVLLLVPLSVGLLGVSPLRLTSEGLLQSALPMLVGHLVLTRWITRQSRTALLPELYRWLLLLPLFGTVLLTLSGRPRAFKVTPKALSGSVKRRRQCLDSVPLLVLLGLQSLALFNLARFCWRPGVGLQLPGELSTTTLVVILGLALVTTLLLMAAWRTGHDRGRDSAIPWFSWDEPVTLNGQQARLTAISETGAELWLAEPLCSPLPLQLQLVSRDGLALPLQCQTIDGRALGGHWGELDVHQAELLHQRLYQRTGQWPLRRAPAEPIALLVVLKRLFIPLGRECWFHRSLIPVVPLGAVASRP